MPHGPTDGLPLLDADAYESLVQANGALIYAWDSTERITTLNAPLRALTGFSGSSSHTLRGFFRQLYPEPHLRQAVLAAHRAGGLPVGTVEWVMTTQSGEERLVRWRVQRFGEGDGVIGIAIGQDLTELRQLEQWVRLQGAILERSADAILVTDPEGRIVRWSGIATSLFGYDPASAVDRPLSNLLPGEHARHVVQEWLHVVRDTGEAEWVRELRRATGELFECRIRAASVRDDAGSMVGVALMITPTRAQPPAAAEPRATVGLERFLHQVATVAIIVTDAAGTVETWSLGAERLSGVSAAKAEGRRLLDEVLIVQSLQWDVVYSRLSQRGRYTNRVEVRRAGGDHVPADLDAIGLRRPDGALYAVVCVIVDRSEAQTLIREALPTKSRALRTAVGEGLSRRVLDVAGLFEPDQHVLLAWLHDLRVLLRSIANGVSWAALEDQLRQSRLLQLDQQIDEAAARIGEAVHRLRAVADDIHRFESPPGPPTGAVRLTRELASARELLDHVYGHRLTVAIVGGEPVAARGSAPPLLRALCLILLAADDTTRNVPDPRLTIEGGVDGGFVQLEFRDNGAGYSVDVQSRLSDHPWLATQPGYGALYLGLARDAVRQAGGQFDISSAPGSGARVRVIFPSLESTAAELPPATEPAEAETYGHVLIVDDDLYARQGLARQLSDRYLVGSLAAFPDVSEPMVDVPDALIYTLPRSENHGLRELDQLAVARPDLHGRTIVLVSPGLRQEVREQLLRRGLLMLPRPLDLTSLRSLLHRLHVPAPAEEEGGEEAGEDEEALYEVDLPETEELDPNDPHYAALRREAP